MSTETFEQVLPLSDVMFSMEDDLPSPTAEN